MSVGAQGRSLHIGLNQVDAGKYKDEEGTGWHGLLGTCETDATDMAGLARSQGLSAITLLSSRATAAAILTALRSAAGTLRGGDLFLLTFSGHGGSVPDLNGDEIDARDETWVTYDRQLLDDELFGELMGFAAGVRILLVSDTCHSGTIGQRQPPPRHPTGLLAAADPAQAKAKAMPSVVARADAARRSALYTRIQRRMAPAVTSRAELRASVLQFGACKDNESAWIGPVHSVYTGLLLTTWDGGKFQGNYRDLFNAVAEQMPDFQTPQWFVPGLEDPAFFAQRPFSI